MMDKSFIGKELPDQIFEVEKGKIREFATAIGDKNPVYHDEDAARAAGFEGLAIPPTFPTVFAMTRGMLMSLIKTMKIDLSKLLHGGQDYEYISPVKPGDVITGKTKIADIFEKSGKGGTMDFIIVDTIHNNQTGQTVLKDRCTIVVRR